MSTSDFGVFGLGVMGKSIAINIAKNNHKLSVYNRKEAEEATVVSDFLNDNKALQNVQGFTDVEAFVQSLTQPRQILLMVNAGKTVDVVLEALLLYLDKDDIVIDGGNSHYLDSKARFDRLKSKGLHFLSCGISGGEEGAKNGPSMMPSGDKSIYKLVAPVLESISAKDKNGNPCCTYLGEEGSGHFVKMVHNGIEYAEMQLLAECYALLSKNKSYSEIVSIFRSWQHSGLDSYLLDITCQILEKKEGNDYLLDLILDAASNKGTGSWSSKAALDLGLPNTMMSAAVFARYISSFKEERTKLSKLVKTESKAINIDVEALKQAYQFARIINHHQGFILIDSASKTYKWNLNLATIASVWTSGCIIKSQFIEYCVQSLKTNGSLLEDITLVSSLFNSEIQIKTILKSALDARVAIPCLQEAYNYWIGFTTQKSSANVIQAQRDFFGAHTYKRIDKDPKTNFHTNW